MLPQTSARHQDVINKIDKASGKIEVGINSIKPLSSYESSADRNIIFTANSDQLPNFDKKNKENITHPLKIIK